MFWWNKSSQFELTAHLWKYYHFSKVVAMEILNCTPRGPCWVDWFHKKLSRFTYNVQCIIIILCKNFLLERYELPAQVMARQFIPCGDVFIYNGIKSTSISLSFGQWIKSTSISLSIDQSKNSQLQLNIIVAQNSTLKLIVSWYVFIF